MKKIAGQLAAAAILVAALLFVHEIAMAETSGTDGDIQWTLSNDGVLTISGNGYMKNYNPDNYGGDIPTEASWGTGITKVIINQGVKNIGAYAFAQCENLTSVSIPNSVRRIDERAFSYCSNLKNITIPGSVNSIGESAFWGSNSLTDLYCLAENAPTMPYDNVFDEEVFESATLHVPAGSIEAYQDADPWNPWNRFKTIVVLKDSEMMSANFDLNGDGVVNAADVVMLINFIAGKKTE